MLKIIFKDEIKKYEETALNLKISSFIKSFSKVSTPDDRSDSVYWMSGYCYHFALLLKGLFGGKIIQPFNRDHIVWLSDEGNIWDYTGSYMIDELIFIDMSSVSAIELSNWRHIYGRSKEAPTEYCCEEVLREELKMIEEIETRTGDSDFQSHLTSDEIECIRDECDIPTERINNMLSKLNYSEETNLF